MEMEVNEKGRKTKRKSIVLFLSYHMLCFSHLERSERSVICLSEGLGASVQECPT